MTSTNSIEVSFNGSTYTVEVTSEMSAEQLMKTLIDSFDSTDSFFLYKTVGDTKTYISRFELVSKYVGEKCVLLSYSVIPLRERVDLESIDDVHDPHNPHSGNECFDSLCLSYYHETERDGYMYFECGSHSDECLGWDGMSRRCQCGNRRVEYAQDEDDFQIYLRAY